MDDSKSGQHLPTVSAVGEEPRERPVLNQKVLAYFFANVINMAKHNLGRKGLFDLKHPITVLHQGRSGQKLKQKQRLEPWAGY